MSPEKLIEAFETAAIEPDEFRHLDHVKVTFAYLERNPLPETLIWLRDSLKRITVKLGAPDKYHETITFAFAAVVHERMKPDEDWEAFAGRNPDLTSWGKACGVLDRYYSQETLKSEAARTRFILPTR